MKIKFTKMHGCGNDYVYINAMKVHVADWQNLAIKVSNRNFGVGSDGMILICDSEEEVEETEADEESEDEEATEEDEE